MDANQQLYYLKQLNHQEVEKRREAILNLSAFDDPNVYKVLSSHFSDGHPVIRNALSQVFLENKNRMSRYQLIWKGVYQVVDELYRFF